MGQGVQKTNYPFLNSTDVLVIEMQDYEQNGYVVFNAHSQPVQVLIEAFNTVDDQDGVVAGPDLNDTPLASTTVNVVANGMVKFILRGGGGHALAPATFQNRVTMITIQQGFVEVDIAAPSPYRNYLRQPASTPIDT